MLPSELYKKVLSIYLESIKTIKEMPYDDALFYDKLPFIQRRSSSKTSLLNTYLLSIYPELVQYFDFSYRTREITKKEFTYSDKDEIEKQFDELKYNDNLKWKGIAYKYNHFSKDKLIKEILKNGNEICKQIRSLEENQQEEELDNVFKLMQLLGCFQGSRYKHLFANIYISQVPNQFQNKQQEEERINKTTQLFESYKSDLGEELFKEIEEQEGYGDLKINSLFYKAYTKKKNLLPKNWRSILSDLSNYHLSIEGHFYIGINWIVKSKRNLFDGELSSFLTLFESLKSGNSLIAHQNEIHLRLKNGLMAKIEFRLPTNSSKKFRNKEVEIISKSKKSITRLDDFFDSKNDQSDFIVSYKKGHGTHSNYYKDAPIGFYILTKDFIIDIEFKES